ncbi:hypothetical protein GCM10023213_19960 [Prosthecobacter algae]|uniref:Uncharacterized protein n=1 Tax=Prosthecobacter algae TaxID=1144682 RepID=A0ABP9P722_9BACT
MDVEHLALRCETITDVMGRQNSVGDTQYHGIVNDWLVAGQQKGPGPADENPTSRGTNPGPIEFTGLFS